MFNEGNITGSRRDFLAASILVPAVMSLAGHAGAQEQTARPRSAIVTGSSRGIGAATARRLAHDGYRVTVNYLKNHDLAEAVAAEIRAAGGNAIVHQADVSDPVAVTSLFAAHKAAFGAPDVVVANAGIQALGAFSAMEDVAFDRLWAVNLKGCFYTLRAAAGEVPDGGRIIALASGTTILRPPTYGAYAATKIGVEMFVNVLAKELAGRMISVNAVSPGTTNTTLFTDGKTPEQIDGFAKITPHRRLGEPEDIANVIALLCADQGAWVNGQVVYANGGLV
ncbi:3-ketoacyl-ACP reductase [Brucella pseudogrignonensis]|uniref:SDR family oxidoreductase n=1 Tax=Brucella pseudogrignonensis TaxID=419475 RepID=UPI0007DA5809|nr:SDR family oxidoreductase [Brucella pseudogrignonensis]ANG98752.1 3-ketoacyl-ACP reductase [Brucella pseudogrignonensis]